MTKTKPAVSELVGALVLTGIITVVFIIISSNLLSQPLPVEHPAIEFDLSYVCNNDSPDTLLINHGRGDAFKVFDISIKNESGSEFYLRVNGEKWSISNESGDNTFKLIKYNTSDIRYNYFSIGDQLEGESYNFRNTPTIQFIERKPNGAEFLLWEKKAGAGSTCYNVTCPGYVAPPYAAFTAVPQRADVNVTITFDPSGSKVNDIAYPIKWYRWNFGDGTATQVKTDSSTITHTYTQYGLYTATLIVATDCGTDSVSHIITITDIACDSSVTADFTTNPSPPTQIGGTSLTVSFTNTSTSVNSTIVSWLWNFGDGATSTDTNPTHIYSYGSYYARLTVTDSCGKSDTKVVQVSLLNDSDCFVSPLILVTPGTSGYEPYTVTLTDGSTTSIGTITSWLWDFGDGTNANTKGPFNKTYPNGTYIINLTVTNSCGAASSTTQTITVLSGYIITASAGSGGSISPSGNVNVPSGGDQSFIISNSTCYKIQDVRVDGTSLTGPFTSPYTYTFTNVHANHDIYATFSSAYYNITSSTGSNGSITPFGITNVSCGGSQTYNITPDNCYSIANVLVDGVSQGAITTYKFSNLQADHTISATFTPKTYNISATIGTGGIISPLGITPVICNGSQTYTITPNTCYLIANVLVDGSSVGSPTTYTFSNVSADHTISAIFAQKTYNINATAGTGGTISSPGNNSASCGSNKTYIINPENCFSIADVLVDGISQGIISQYTFTNVQADHTISATFTLKPYHINATAGTGGTISPVGNNIISCGGSQTYTIVPNACYSVSSVLVDGISQGAITVYTFSNVTADHTISAAFSIKIYNITATAGTGGTISPVGNNTISCGGNQTYTIVPNACYSISSVQVDGISQGAITVYTFSNVTADHTISATFSLKTYNITAYAGSNGVITPSGNTTVSCGGSQTFNITPNACYFVSSVLVDGVSQGAINTYTFSNVTADHTISAIFILKPYNITATAGPGGSISPSGITSVNCGAGQIYNITPNACYSVANILVDGVSQGSITTYTFSNVQTDHTIDATFTLKSYNITATAGTGGSISPGGISSVTCGNNLTYTVTANSCYNITNVSINGVSQGPHTNPYTYTFTNVQSNQTISALFALKTYEILASAGAGGNISPSGSVYTTCGFNQSFTITAASCYNISSILVDGTPLSGTLTSPYTYTFANVQTTHTISAAFTLKNYIITASAGSNGSISPSGSVSVTCGTNQSFVITANSCYNISSILIDGSAVTGPFTSPYTYTFTNIQAGHTISAAFASSSYIINATATTGGTIFPSGFVSVSCDNNQTFTITPNSGYGIDNVVVDGVSIGIISSFTFTNVQANHTIIASFAQSTGRCAISGYITNATTGVGVAGIRVDVWDNSRTTILRSGVSQSNGYFAINHPRPGSATRVDLNCPDQGTWYTTSPTSPLRGWYDGILINPGGKCDVEDRDFEGLNIVSGNGDFLWNSNSKPGYINSGGEFSFVVGAPVSSNAYIYINGVQYTFAVNDMVKIILLSNQTGGNVFFSSVSGTNQMLTTLAFSNVALYKNGALLASGQCTGGTYIPNMTLISSTLTMTIPTGVDAWTNFIWGGTTIINGNDDKGIVISNIVPSSGTVAGVIKVMQLNIGGGYYRGQGSGFVLL